jgi:hypothetical protein
MCTSEADWNIDMTGPAGNLVVRIQLRAGKEDSDDESSSRTRPSYEYSELVIGGELEAYPVK